jgi:hypothetical protein
MPELEVLKTNDIAIPSSREVNLFKFPFFLLSKNDKRDEIVVKVLERIGTKKVEKTFRATWAPAIGRPGPFVKNVHYGLEQLIIEHSYPVMQVIPFTIYELGRKMGIKNVSGQHYEDIKKALDIIYTISIFCDEVIYDKRKRAFVSHRERFYTKLVMKGEELPDGTIADNNYVFLNEWYMNNLNAKFIVQLENEYYLKLLKKPTAARLYEVTALDFLLNANSKRASSLFRYSDLCCYFPMNRQKHLSVIKKTLGPAIKELTATKFLADCEIKESPLRDMGDSLPDYLIELWPGERALDYVEANQGLKLDVPKKAFAIEAVEEKNTHDPLDALSPSMRQAYEQLLECNVSKQIALKLTVEYEVARIKDVCEASHFVEGIRNRGGWIANSLKNEWALPDAFILEKQKREKKGKKASDRDNGRQSRLDLEQSDIETAAIKKKNDEAMALFKQLEHQDQLEGLVSAIKKSSFIPESKRKTLLPLIEACMSEKSPLEALKNELSVPEWVMIEYLIHEIINQAQVGPEPV